MTRLSGFALCLALLAFFVAPAFAEDAAKTPPSRDTLVSFWEQRIKADPHVQQFEKTKEDGVYDFKTDFFPYKGKLKLLNAVVTVSDEEYYQNLYRGIIEVDLPDANDTFFKKYARSYGAWTQANNFYYDMKKGVWFAAADWDTYAPDFDKYAASASSSSKAEGCWVSSLVNSNLFFLLVFALIVGALMVLARKQNKRVWTNQEKVMTEQQRGLKMAEESLKHQIEHTRLLQEILTALKK